jgi:hypothetical protein
MLSSFVKKHIALPKRPTMVRIYSFCILLLLGLQLSAQTDTSTVPEGEEEEGVLFMPVLNEQTKLGVKLGSGVSTLLGNELSNPRPTYMLSGGAYMRYRFSKHWSIQPEANVSLRGSNFSNGADQYESIRIYYIDLPVLIMMGFDEKNQKNILAGVQYSRILNSSLYVSGASLPENTSPALKKDDVMGVLGAQFHTPYVGFQLVAKYGFIDINNGLLPGLNPPNTGKDIHNFIVELNLLF